MVEVLGAMVYRTYIYICTHYITCIEGLYLQIMETRWKLLFGFRVLGFRILVLDCNVGRMIFQVHGEKLTVKGIYLEPQIGNPKKIVGT